MEKEKYEAADGYRQNRNYSRARILTLVPIAVFILTAVCMINAAIFASPTGKGVIYSFFALIGLLSMFLSPLPCLAASIAGTVFAARAVKNGIPQARKFLVLGILEILVCAAGLALAIVLFVGGQGV